MRLIIYGEIILDRYYICTSNRIAPEFNIPIYDVNKIEDKLGGAANVAFNLNDYCDLLLISVIGDDNISKTIIDILNSNNIKNKTFISNRKSIIKNRTICDKIIKHRLDIEDTFDIPEKLIMEITLYFDNLFKIEKYDGFILSDYNKGILPFNLSRNIIDLCNKYNISTFIDPKIENIEKYKNCTFFKPNLLEAKKILNICDNFESDNIDNSYVLELYNKINCKFILITKGSYGMIGYDGRAFFDIKHNNNIDVIDVTGAGDTVMSVFTYIFTLTNDFLFSCKISNNIAGKSVTFLGNYKFTIEDIYQSNKIINSLETNIIKNLRKIHSNIIFTNGCFDIVHIGHLKLLKYCKELNGTFVLALNSDSSIKENKGNNRPINNELDRVEFIKLLDIVDYIIIFNEKTPLEIIKNLEPDILVKGSDYNIDNVIGKEYSKKVLFFDLIKNKSTTNIINKIKL